MDKILNMELLGSPYNWIIIWLMAATAGLGLTYIVQHAKNPEG